MNGDDASPTDRSGGERHSLDALVQPAILGMSAVAMVAVAWAHWETPVVALGLAALLAVCGWLSAIDYEQHRLPNRVVGPLAVAVTIALVAGGFATDDMGRSGRALLIGLAASTILLLANLAGGMGMGDVKYAFPLAAVLGWFGTEPVLTWAFVTALAGGAAGLVMIVAGHGRRHRIPYGPFMTIGLFAGLLSAAPGL